MKFCVHRLNYTLNDSNSTEYRPWYNNDIIKKLINHCSSILILIYLLFTKFVTLHHFEKCAILTFRFPAFILLMMPRAIMILCNVTYKDTIVIIKHKLNEKHNNNNDLFSVFSGGRAEPSIAIHPIKSLLINNLLTYLYLQITMVW